MTITSGCSDGGGGGGSADGLSTELDYDANGNVIYLGRAAAGSAVAAAAWQIRRLDYDASGNLIDVLFAGGVTTFINAWSNRTGYTYS